ncbi:MAG: pectate lyase [Pirellulales bacterium]|nr:pectate lyase [Pirellulales bacterium]
MYAFRPYFLILELQILILAASTILMPPSTVAAADSWRDYAARPDSWYRSEEGLRVADNVLSFQSPQGSWPKSVATAATRYQGDPRRLRGTFDNGATRSEIRFLARAYRATAEPRFQDAVQRALDHILQAQYASGGWPQSYPPGNGYHRHITFNDGTMVGLMLLLREVADSDAFALVGPLRRRQAGEAFERGVDCILKCQIVVDGQPTAWCAQHDAETLQPRGARSYEHPSLSGGESAGIVRLLMGLDDPGPDVVWAVNAACQWYRQAKLTGIRQIRRDGDKQIVPDPKAPPLWARFYEIGTNRPIFSGRDGVIKYDLAQIERERRTGYSWYGPWGAEVLADWAKWKQKHGQ